MDPSWVALEHHKRVLLEHSLAPKSMTSYQVGIRQYLRFCSSFSIPPLPLSQLVVENFCTSLSRRVSHKTIKAYLAAVQFWSKVRGYSSLIRNMPRLPYVLLAIQRSQGRSFARPDRPPITLPMLEAICAFAFRNESPFNRDMLIAAALLAFFGLLRVSEYTSASASSFDESADLSARDVFIDWRRRVALVRIKKSKTDPFRSGVTIRVGIIDSHLCPVHALARYLRRRGRAPGPLFLFQSGAFLTRARVVDLLHRSLPEVPHVNTHSFRRGGASALAIAGTPAHVIQVLGRWRSDAFKAYVEFSDDFLVTTNRAMASGG